MRNYSMPDPQSAGADPIIEAFRNHYTASFIRHGATSRGVDWGESEGVQIRYRKMLEVIEPEWAAQGPVSVLDAGCGFGGLWDHVKAQRLAINYTGIDLVPEMIEHARAKHPDAHFTVGDIFALAESQVFDYVVCNGILTLKLETSILDMDRFARRLVRRMFCAARRGIAFNIMSSHVNFMASHLYYKNPLEIIGFCATELSRRFKLDHAYPLYEYTVYVYRDDSRPGTPGSAK